MQTNNLPDLVLLPDGEAVKRYYYWLCDLTGGYDNYSRLMNSLHRKRFLWSVPNDDNRGTEGKELRLKFCDENNIFYDETQYDYACSMLELIIALAYRCENIVSDHPRNLTVREWFWQILSNVELDRFDDSTWDAANVDVILNRIIDRSYQKNGGGGLFPLKHTKKDQRKVEIWYQMNGYLIENYYN